ncbi:venom factor-like [Mantella aurantiaca]
MGYRALCFILLGFLTGSTYAQSCTLITSNVLRVDSEETFLVDGHGTAFDGEIIVQNFPEKKISIARGNISVNSGNGFLEITKLLASAFLVPSINLDKDSEKKQFVCVTVNSGPCKLEKVVLVSYQNGYIVIQTDKPIYTPGSQVLFRIYSMTPDLKPINKPMVIEVLTPENVIIKKEVIQQANTKGILSSNYSLSGLASLGVWTMAAKFEDSVTHDYTTHFEVKEYVLPSFEVKIIVDQKFYYITDEEFEVQIQANYLNGKFFEGMAYVLFSVTRDGLKKSLPNTLRRISISDGEGSTALRREDIVKHFQQERDMLQWRLSVSATVITNSGSDMVEAELTDIHMVTSPYKVLYTKTSKFFKPGMPMDLMVFVSNPDGTPIHSVPVVVEPGTVRAYTLKDGTIRLTINPPSDISVLKIIVTTADPKLPDNQQASAFMTATAYRPLGGNYLHLSFACGELKVGEIAAINFLIKNTNPAIQNQITHFNYIILNKARIMRTGRQERTPGQSLVTLMLPITPEFIPSFRMLAYYVVSNGANREIVADSVWIDVTDTCMGTLTLSGERDRDNKVHLPGAAMKLRVKADHKASVALVAVNRGVYLLNDRYKISQTKVWDSVEKYDTGCTAGGGADAAGVFYDAGLALSNSFHGSTPQRSGDAGLDFSNDSDIVSRTEFPESWLWKIVSMNEKPDANGISSKSLSVFLKDAITTWEILAVSLSEHKGICVSNPYIQVMKSFFIDLQLPYTVVKNEQVEIRAILYNYGNSDLKVRVEWTYNKEFCSLSTTKSKYRQFVIVKAASSLAIPYVIIPLTLGDHEVEVMAAGKFVSDGVKKNLKVVLEGRRVVQTLSNIVLDPDGKGRAGVQEELIKTEDIKNIVPNTKIETIVSVQGTTVNQLVENIIDGANLNHLITAPQGNGEQIMMTLTPTVIVTHYLDSTGQWEKIGVDRRTEAIQHINNGLLKQLAFRKSDTSYGAWIYLPSSTWLTAYVVKVFSLAQELIEIDKGVLCNPLKWLMLETQKPDGLFAERFPVYQQEMVGGITKRAIELDTTVTAFVLIAMLESKESCTGHVNRLQLSIDRAIEYIQQQYPNIRKPYSIAIASYALARAGRLANIDKLMSACTDNNHWEEPGSSQVSLEATSYGLLALVKMEEYDKAEPVVQWLTEQKFYGEAWGSTQSTIMIFQSMAQYYLEAPWRKNLDMNVSFTLPGKSLSTMIRLNNQNALNAHSDQTEGVGNFVVTATGKGQGTLSVFFVYYALETETTKQCKNFDLSLKVQDEPLVKAPEGTLSTVSLTICTRYLKDQDAGMSILQVSMMTGFTADIDDLNKLKTGAVRYINDFEINKETFDKRTLVLYIDKISHTEDMCLKFNLHQYFKVGFIQPASVTVYDYYSPENRCTKFYHGDKNSNLLSKICIGDVCHCTEERCFMQQQLEKVDANARFVSACEVGVDYVYKTTLSEIKEENKYFTYVMTITLVIKEGSDKVQGNQKRNFISHAKCRKALNLQVGRNYMVWGITKDLWNLDSGYSYIVTKDTWIEMWPNERECQQAKYETVCDELIDFSDELQFHGCP